VSLFHGFMPEVLARRIQSTGLMRPVALSSDFKPSKQWLRDASEIETAADDQLHALCQFTFERFMWRRGRGD
jgi:hypothetical protein